MTRLEYTEQVALLRFECGGRLFAVDIRSVQDVVERPYIALFPETRPPLIGIANIRGRIISVRACTGMAPASAPRLLVLEFEPGRPFGVLVDKVQKLNLDARDLEGVEHIPLQGDPVRYVRSEQALSEGA